MGVRVRGCEARGNVLEGGVGCLVGERKTATTEAIMVTIVYRFGCIISYGLRDTSWGCAFGVGRPGERVPAGESEGSDVDPST
jgi:hypothetical protein